MDLLYFAKRYRDEFAVDHIARLAFHNGFKSPKKFLDMMREDNFNLRDSDIRLSDSEFVPTDGTWLYPTLNNYIRNKFRICEQCINELAYVRSYWYCRLYSVCHVHKTSLVYVSSSPFKYSFESIGSNDSLVVQNHFVCEKAIEYYRGASDITKLLKSEIGKSIGEEYLVNQLALSLTLVFGRDVDSAATQRLIRQGKLVTFSVDERVDVLVESVSSENRILKKDVKFFFFLICLALSNSKLNLGRIPRQSYVAEYSSWCRHLLLRIANSLSDREREVDPFVIMNKNKRTEAIMTFNKLYGLNSSLRPFRFLINSYYATR